MIYQSAEKSRKVDKVVDVVQSDVDYVDSNGDMHLHVKTPNVMVRNYSDLSGLTVYTPGTIAFTAGYNNMWQLDASGTWKVIVEEQAGT